MNSTVNMILALKLKLILIILSIGASYFLEHNARLRSIQEPKSIVIIQTDWKNEGMPSYKGQEKTIPVKEIFPVAEPKPNEPEPVNSNTCGLSDLRLHIEL